MASSASPSTAPISGSTCASEVMEADGACPVRLHVAVGCGARKYQLCRQTPGVVSRLSSFVFRLSCRLSFEVNLHGCPLRSSSCFILGLGLLGHIVAKWGPQEGFNLPLASSLETSLRKAWPGCFLSCWLSSKMSWRICLDGLIKKGSSLCLVWTLATNFLRLSPILVSPQVLTTLIL